MDITIFPPIIIRKNSKELRDKLEALGYKKSQTSEGGWDEKALDKRRCIYIFTSIVGSFYVCTNIENMSNVMLSRMNDCGEDEEQFLNSAKNITFLVK